MLSHRAASTPLRKKERLSLARPSGPCNAGILGKKKKKIRLHPWSCRGEGEGGDAGCWTFASTCRASTWHMGAANCMYDMRPRQGASAIPPFLALGFELRLEPVLSLTAAREL